MTDRSDWRLLALACLGAIFAVLAPDRAHAACVLTGTTVTCTEQDDNGITAGNGVNVTVVPGAFVQSFYDGFDPDVCAGFRSAITVGRGATITNRGTLLGRGNCSLGIEAGDTLTLTNEGDIRTGDNLSFAILTGNAYDVTNRARITALNFGSTAFVGGSNGRFVNAATGVIETSGADSAGIFAENGNTITNDGRITTGNLGSTGIEVGGGNTVTNTGTIATTGVASSGIQLRGSGNTVTNRGTITTLPVATPRSGEDSIGIVAETGGNIIANSSTIAGDYAGVLMIGTNNQLTNSGAISARAPTAASTPGGAIVVSGGSATITNNINSTIRGIGSAAIVARSDAALTLTNLGRIDGDIVLGNRGSVVTLGNSSLVVGALRGSAVAADALILDGAGSLTGQVTNFDTVEKRGAGVWTVPLSLGPLDVTGAVTVNEGRLDAAGFRTTRLTIAPNAQLRGPVTITGPRSGVGFADTNVIINGAVFVSSGVSATREVTTVQGTIDFGAGSVIESKLAGTFGDLLTATGRMTFAGGQIILRTGITPARAGQNYVIVSAGELRNSAGAVCGGTLTDTGAVTGTPCLTRLTDVWPTFIRSTATVTNTSITVRLDRVPYASVAQSSEGVAIADILEQARNGAPGLSGFEGLLANIDSLDESTAQAAFTTFSSDLPVAVQTWGVLAGGTLANSVSPWLELAPADSQKGEWRTWGNTMVRDGSGAEATDPGHFDYDAKGAVAGTDLAVADGTRIGLMAAYQEGKIFLPTGPASANVSTSAGGGYISQAWPKWRAGAGVLIGDGKARMTRTRTNFTPGNPSDIAARTNTSTDAAFAQLSYSHQTETWLVKPTSILTYVRAKTDAYAEPGVFGLKVAGQTASSLRGDVGVRAIAKPGPVHITLAMLWSQNFKQNDRSVTVDGFNRPGSAFTVTGQTEKRGWLNAQVGANIEILPGMMARVGWSGILNDRLGGHTASAGISYRW